MPKLKTFGPHLLLFVFVALLYLSGLLNSAEHALMELRFGLSERDAGG